MSLQQTATRIVIFPFRALWFLILSINFLIVSAACVLIAAFVAYALALTISYLFFPAAWTRGLWEWAASLYAQSPWFKGATITVFVLLLLPVLKLWPGRDLKADTAREREAMRINDDLIAARQRTLAQAKLRG
ncbi:MULTISPECIES: hypothetical protein [unclassified Rhizobium]|uniref:hypothetical protein n=1 Tax=unclassified Rhizobium TaxID=2613769 RepID=UPI0016143D29|nr:MULTISPECIES: hypothetical protein [unclassified Rhizobium]MBB3386245.1 hypothetical protein [Rhizobium sp. BK098]MBB3571765.1 hypothetical protein [Rhizobium sp. BK491]MBB3617949.1 hypothetical protein [Rhizobium sp. BK609]MBB3683598.1 hypothetical protein [Rhizobium sp. BK612]